MSKSTLEYVLWGWHKSHGGKDAPLKIMGGSLSECLKAKDSRAKDGWKGLIVRRKGDSYELAGKAES